MFGSYGISIQCPLIDCQNILIIVMFSKCIDIANCTQRMRNLQCYKRETSAWLLLPSFVSTYNYTVNYDYNTLDFTFIPSCFFTVLLRIILLCVCNNYLILNFSQFTNRLYNYYYSQKRLIVLRYRNSVFRPSRRPLLMSDY